MTPTPELIQDALNDGMNIKLIIQELQLDNDTLTLKLETNGFDPEENRLIRRLIKSWRQGE